MNRKLVLITSIAINVIFIMSAIIILQTRSTMLAEKESTENAKPEEVKTNIVMLGNSITYQGNWKEVLGREDVFNGGKPGWTTQQLSWVIKDFILPKKPVLCFFTGGINDYTLGIPTERIFQNCTMVMDSISSCGTHPVWQTTLYQRGNVNTNLEIDVLNGKMEQFCRERNYDFVDLRPFLCNDGDILDEYIQDDNTHLKPAAYPQWAEAIQPVIQKYQL